jgi:capsular polysaccharide biosynthesis protein
MRQIGLFKKAEVIAETIGSRAKAVLAARQIHHITAGGTREPYRYFLK